VFDLTESPTALVARAVLIYGFLFVMFRFLGKKHTGELAPFDLLILLIISETVQNGLIGDDKSVIGAMICASTLFIIMQALNYVSWRSRKASRLIEGVPKVLVRDGVPIDPVMEKEKITKQELLEAMRSSGCSNIGDVRAAILENNGKISIIKAA